MKKIMYITTLCFLLLLSGCGGYTRDETPGALRTISVADMEKKMKNKEDFVIVFTQSWCAHCEKFRDMLDEYLPKHHVIVYDVVIDKDPNPDRSGNIKKIQSYFKTMDSTPSLYYVEKVRSKMNWKTAMMESRKKNSTAGSKTLSSMKRNKKFALNSVEN